MTKKSEKSINFPLLGKKILVTRAEDQNTEIADQLRQYGATPILLPTIRIIPLENYSELDRSIKRLSTYDWLIFTSLNGVKYFLSRLEEIGGCIEKLGDAKIAAIGTKTGQILKAHGIKVDFIPGKYRAEGLIDGMKKAGIKGKKVLIPRAESAREILPQELRKWGAEVDVIAVYKTIKPSYSAEYRKKFIKKGEIDVITFTSSSTVTNFVAIFSEQELGTLTSGSLVACIGPITQKTAEKKGIKTDIMPEEYTTRALIEAIIKFYENSTSNSNNLQPSG